MSELGFVERLNVRDCGRESCAPMHSFGPAMRGYYLLHLVASGCGVFDNGHGRFDVHAGQGFMIFPEDVSIYTADSDTPWDYVWVGFHGADAPRLVQSAGLDPDHPVIDFSRYADSVLEIAYGIYKDTSFLQLYGAAAAGGLLRLMSYLCQCRYDASPSRSAEAGADVYRRALWYLNANYQRTDFHIGDVAAFVGLSRSQLFRIFKAQGDRAPQEILGELRLSHARRLLSGTALSLTEVALSSGFSSSSRLGEVFRVAFGVSPTQYRQSTRP